MNFGERSPPTKGSLGIDISHEHGQVLVPQHLANGGIFPGVIPVMIDRALQQVAI
jgi:hypothetical protein